MISTEPVWRQCFGKAGVPSIGVTEPVPDLDREVPMDDDEAAAVLDGPREKDAERVRRRESENDARLLEDRPPHW